MLRSYLESMSEDFNVGGFFNKKKKKLQIQQQRLLTATDALQEHVNQQIRSTNTRRHVICYAFYQ